MCGSPAFSTRSCWALLAGALFALAPGGGSAQPEQTLTACLSRATNTHDMQVCQGSALDDANRRLAAAYDAALAALPSDRRAKLRMAQARWVAFRSADCQVYFGSDTGTLATVEGGRCTLDRTEARIDELTSLHARGN